MAAASAAPLFINGAIKMGTPSQPQVSFGGCKVRDTKALNSELCRNLYHSIPKPQKPIVMSASGVQNLVLAEASAKPWLHKPFKCLDCGPLFLKNGCYMEMIKGIQGHGYYDELVIPFLIMETTALEGELADSLAEARVLGGYRNAEVTAKARTSSNGIESPRRCIVLDIEGTTTPISFVTDVLFPYARDNVRKHLELTYDTEKTQDDIVLLQAQVQEDLENNVVEAVPIPSDGDREEVIAALVANVNAMIKADRKITSLKQLQGHIWQTGFQNKEIETVVYDDVPEALEKWQALGLKVYIYSSGSRLAQRLLFGNTNYGDLRNYLCGFFDTTIGNKRETKSYIEITESLGVDDPSEVLFVTDVYQEATAAKAAGLEVTISVRPGNGPLPENHGFRTVNSFSEI